MSRFPSFANQDGTFFSESAVYPVRVVAPLTGTTVSMRWQDNDLFVNAAGTLATLTIAMERKPDDGFQCDISTKNTITALTITDGFGNTVGGAPTSLAAGSSVLMRFVNKAVGWQKWR